MTTITVGSLVNDVQLGAAGIFIIAGLVQSFRIERDVPVLKYTLRAAFIVLMGGIAFGKYYATGAPKRLEPIETSKPAAALVGYTEAILLDPSKAELYFRRGRTEHYLKRYADAVSDFSKALELSSDNPKYLTNRAYSRLYLHDVASAERDINKAIEGGYRDNPETLMVQAMISSKHDHFEDAIKQYTAALSSGGLNPEYRCFSLIERGIAYEKKGEFAKALDDFNSADCESAREVVLVNRGTLYGLMNHDELARKDWQLALMLYPNDPVVFKNRGTHFLVRGKLEQALADINRYVEMRPDDPYGYTIRSEIYAKMGKQENAQTDLKLAGELYATNRARLYPTQNW
jgi:tetratricopeptide (TPR) repeat protein